MALLALAAVLLTAVLAMTGPASAKKAKSLGPTPLAGDCRFYQKPSGGPECYQDLWSGRFEVGQHIVQVGDIVTAKVQIVAGYAPVYSWASPGGEGLTKQQCPESATATAPYNLVGWAATCTFKATSVTNKWVIFGPQMGLATSGYPDQDYYAVVGGGSINGRVLDEEGKGVGGVRVNIMGPQKLFAVTEPSGMYSAIDIAEGSYVVSVNKKGFCVDNGGSISRKTCTPSKRVTAGNPEVTFTKLGKNSIEGSIEDQWDRPIAGIEVKITGDGLDQSEWTDENGRYQLGVDGAGPFTVKPVTAGRGPHEAYYLVQNGEPTNGISAEVNFNRKIGTATVDWELDRTLELRGGKAAAPSSGHSRLDYDLEVITQVGTRVPKGIPLRVANAAGGDPQSTVTCVDGEQVLPNKDFGGSLVTTNADGLVQFTVYPGETPVWYMVLVRLVDDPNSDRYYSPPWTLYTPESWGRALGTAEQLNLDIRQAILDANGEGKKQPTEMPTDPIAAVDWLVGIQDGSSRIKGLAFGPVHGANGGEAVAIWPVGKPPKVNPDGSVQEGAEVRILDQNLFVNAYPTLPTISEWANGSANVPAHGTVLRGSAADPGNAQTFFGWPMAIRSNHGLIACLGDHPNSYSRFEVRGPATLTFDQGSGKRVLGERALKAIDARESFDGQVRTYTLPKAAYKVRIVATGKGAVAIRSDAANGVTTARFDVKKGQKASLALKAGAPLSAFKIGGVKAQLLKGTPLIAVGLPKRVKSGRPWRARGRIVDASGAPVAGAYIHVKDGLDDTDAWYYADEDGKIDVWMPALVRGSRVTLRAPGWKTQSLPIRLVR